MAKAYWVAEVEVLDTEPYEEYKKLAAPAVAEFGGRYLARGGKSEVMEGNARSRRVIIEFPDYDSAVNCYRSEAYGKAIAARKGHSEGKIFIVEGV